VVVLEASRKREYICIRYFALSRACQHGVYNLDKTLERIASFSKISGLLFSLSRPDWPLMTSTHRLMRRLGIIVASLHREKASARREIERKSCTVALLSVQSFASITLFDD